MPAVASSLSSAAIGCTTATQALPVGGSTSMGPLSLARASSHRQPIGEAKSALHQPLGTRVAQPSSDQSHSMHYSTATGLSGSALPVSLPVPTSGTQPVRAGLTQDADGDAAMATSAGMTHGGGRGQSEDSPLVAIVSHPCCAKLLLVVRCTGVALKQPLCVGGGLPLSLTSSPNGNN